MSVWIPPAGMPRTVWFLRVGSAATSPTLAFPAAASTRCAPRLLRAPGSIEHLQCETRSRSRRCVRRRWRVVLAVLGDAAGEDRTRRGTENRNVGRRADERAQARGNDTGRHERGTDTGHGARCLAGGRRSCEVFATAACQDSGFGFRCAQSYVAHVRRTSGASPARGSLGRRSRGRKTSSPTPARAERIGSARRARSSCETHAERAARGRARSADDRGALCVRQHRDGQAACRSVLVRAPEQRARRTPPRASRTPNAIAARTWR